MFRGRVPCMKKILVVDDSMLVTNVLKVRLEHVGYKVFFAHDGHGAIEQVKIKKPDIILLDLMLPKSGGLEVIKNLRLDKQNDKIPIIAMSANDSESYMNKSIKLGASAFVKKPIDFLEIETKISENI